MPVTRNQASSTNEGEEDTLQRLLRVVATLQARSDEQSRLSAEAEQRQAEAEECHHQVEERHLEAMRMAELREEELRQQIAALKAANRLEPGPADDNSGQSFWGRLFSVEIDEALVPTNFREIIIEPFDGTQDSHAHLQAFQTQIYISGGGDRLSCKLFPGTLRGVAMQWMATLPPRSIHTFNDLARLFVSQFAANKVKKMGGPGRVDWANATPLGRWESGSAITFDDRDLKLGPPIHDEPMVISVVAAEYKVERVLIDQGSSANILYWSVFWKMGLQYLNGSQGALYDFAGECVPIRGTIEIETVFGEGPTARIIPVLYTVIDVEASYNIIIG
ncbi:hypothetical protein CR513_40798, partial [Mucuna pruriens]